MDTVETIFSLLSESGKSQQELADSLGVPKNKVSEWKSHKTKSYEKYISQIASFFGVSTDYLLGKTSIKKEPTQHEIEQAQLIADLCKEKGIEITKDNMDMLLNIVKASTDIVLKQINDKK